MEEAEPRQRNRRFGFHGRPPTGYGHPGRRRRNDGALPIHHSTRDPPPAAVPADALVPTSRVPTLHTPEPERLPVHPISRPTTRHDRASARDEGRIRPGVARGISFGGRGGSDLFSLPPWGGRILRHTSAIVPLAPTKKTCHCGWNRTAMLSIRRELALPALPRQSGRPSPGTGCNADPAGPSCVDGNGGAGCGTRTSGHLDAEPPKNRIG